MWDASVCAERLARWGVGHSREEQAKSPVNDTEFLLGLLVAIVTVGLVALVGHEVLGLPWAAAFVLGAVVAPTDPVAAEAVFARLRAPDRVSTVVGGESLVNDGSTEVRSRRRSCDGSSATSIWRRRGSGAEAEACPQPSVGSIAGGDDERRRRSAWRARTSDR